MDNSYEMSLKDLISHLTQNTIEFQLLFKMMENFNCKFPQESIILPLFEEVNNIESFIDKTIVKMHNKLIKVLEDNLTKVSASSTPFETSSNTTPKISTKFNLYSFSNDNQDIVHIDDRIKDIKVPYCLSYGQQKLIDVIMDYSENSEKYFQTFCIIQSTGYGKTKSCFELSKVLRCVYIQCANKSNNRDKPNIIDIMILDLRANPKVGSKKIIYCLLKCSEKYETVEKLHEAQFGENGQFYYELGDLWRNVAVSPISLRVKFNTEVKGGETITNDIIDDKENIENLLNKLYEKFSDLIIIFDEAVGLMKNFNNEFDKSVNSPIRSIYREINNSPKGLKGLFLSTSSNIKYLIPSHIDSEYGATKVDSRIDYPPITDIVFVDIFREKELFLLGRPLWYAKYHICFNRDMNKLVEYAFVLLTDYAKNLQSEGRTGIIHHEFACCALVCCRFNFRPIPQYTDNFVSHFLVTLLYIDSSRKEEESEYCLCSYLPEPILSEASAYANHYHSETFSQEIVLLTFIKRVHGPGQIITPSLGDIGEYAAVLALAFSMDNLRRLKMTNQYDYYIANFSENVLIIDLLKSIRKSDFNFEVIEEDLRGFEVNFTQFIRVPFFNNDLIITAFKRRDAFILKANHRSIDLLVIMYNEVSDKYGALFIQVKNYTSYIAEGKASIILEQIQISDLKDCTIFDNNISVSLLIATPGKVMGKERPIYEITRSTRVSIRENSVNNNNKIALPTKILMTASIQDFSVLSEKVRTLLQDFSQFPVKLSPEAFSCSLGGYKNALQLQDAEFEDNNKDRIINL